MTDVNRALRPVATTTGSTGSPQVFTSSNNQAHKIISPPPVQPPRKRKSSKSTVPEPSLLLAAAAAAAAAAAKKRNDQHNSFSGTFLRESISFGVENEPTSHFDADDSVLPSPPAITSLSCSAPSCPEGPNAPLLSPPNNLTGRHRLSSESAPPVYPSRSGAPLRPIAPSPWRPFTGPTLTASPPSNLSLTMGNLVNRRCSSTRELGSLATTTTAPSSLKNPKLQQQQYVKRRRSETSMDLKETDRSNQTSNNSSKGLCKGDISSNDNQCAATTPTTIKYGSLKEEHEQQQGVYPTRSNKARNRKRAEHNHAIMADLCEVVTDLFLAEAKLLKPAHYGVNYALEDATVEGGLSNGGGVTSTETSSTTPRREHVFGSIKAFFESLPTRYALGCDTPSQVLLHMRLMAAARANPERAVVHITNLENDTYWIRNENVATPSNLKLRLVTISAVDCGGLLNYLTGILGTGGSRVLDADIMNSSDGIVLDRFVVQMNGMLRLDKLASLIGNFLKAQKKALNQSIADASSIATSEEGSCCMSNRSPNMALYYQPPEQNLVIPTPEEELKSAIPLSHVITTLPTEATAKDNDDILPQHDRHIIGLERDAMIPASLETTRLPNVRLAPQRKVCTGQEDDNPQEENPASSFRHKRPLINRPRAVNLDRIGCDDDESGSSSSAALEIEAIPFDELMLIEALGRGRVSTVHRALWKRCHGDEGSSPFLEELKMVALKVAMATPEVGHKAHIEELRREAAIAARLNHPNICKLVGVASDPECYCLAFEYCEGGSLLSLLSDHSRYYEYLPIALDIANAMAYLHSNNVIHRDLKPSNILLTKDNRVKISDFGMSVANCGQELTAETGTYRYMAPEVIRHESYSSNADVYSFGICLWQLITRQIPFATRTPIQAAYAVAEGQRPEIPSSVPLALREIIEACWDQDSYKRPSFMLIAMTLAGYVTKAFSPANVGASTLRIANEMLLTVEGNSTVNVDYTAPVMTSLVSRESFGSAIGLDVDA